MRPPLGLGFQRELPVVREIDGPMYMGGLPCSLQVKE